MTTSTSGKSRPLAATSVHKSTAGLAGNEAWFVKEARVLVRILG